MPNALLEPVDVETIHNLREQGLTHQRIADIIGVGRTTISRVLNKKRYCEEAYE